MAYVTLGPWGGEGGKAWDFMLSGGLKKIIVRYGNCIHSIVFQDSSGTYSEKFGSPDSGDRNVEVIIDCPNEYLVSLSGRYGPYGRAGTAVKYLMFQTNVKSYSFGYPHDEDTYFSIPVKNGSFVGFHGRHSQLLNSIGLHVAPGASLGEASRSAIALGEMSL